MVENKNKYFTRLENERESIIDHLQYQNEIYADFSNDEFSTFKLKEHLERIEKALCRSRSDQYVICLYCGRLIDNERLDLIPEVELCINCQKIKESKSIKTYMMDLTFQL
jgi:RNA polymerase-binding transcription factor DksA